MNTWIAITNGVVSFVTKEDPTNGYTGPDSPWIKVDEQYEDIVQEGDSMVEVKLSKNEGGGKAVAFIPQDLEEGKAKLLQKVSAKRREEQQKPIKYKDKLFNTDNVTVSAITAKMEDLRNSATMEDKALSDLPKINWKSKNGFIKLDYNDLAVIKSAINTHTQHTFDTEALITEKIIGLMDFTKVVSTYNNEMKISNWGIFNYENKDFGVIPVMPS